MDIPISIVTGLGLRAFLSNASDKLSPAVVGIWEGVVVHHFSAKSSPIDHYLAYVLRLAVDILVTGSPLRLIMVLLWTTLGMVASEVVNPILRQDTKRERRHRHSRHTLSHIQQPPQTQLTTPPFLKQTDAKLQTTHNTPPFSASMPLLPPPTPQFEPIPPATPPSFFLHDEPETFSPSPKPVQLQLASSQFSPAQRPRSALASFLEEGSESGSPPKYINLPPTPPDSSVPDASAGQIIETPSHRRLSTIAETEEATPPNPSPEQPSPPVNFISYPVHEYKSVDEDDGESPRSEDLDQMAVPAYVLFEPPQQRLDDVEIVTTNLTTPYAPSTTAPLPIPYRLQRMENSRPATPDEMDELRTPGQPSFDIEEDEDTGDELQTPVGLRAQLSPLFLGGGVQQHDLNANSETQPLIFAPPDSNHEPEPEPEPEITMPRPIDPGAVTRIQAQSTVVSDLQHDQAVFSAEETESVASVVSPAPPNALFRRAEALRQEARTEEKNYLRIKNDLKLAEREGRARDAVFLRVELRNSEAKVQKLHQRAARRFVLSRNSSSKSLTLDVHGLRPREALEAVEEELKNTLAKGETTLKVIVGKGLHSQSGQPVLKHAVIREMQRVKIACTVDPRNAGVLILRLPNT